MPGAWGEYSVVSAERGGWRGVPQRIEDLCACIDRWAGERKDGLMSGGHREWTMEREAGHRKICLCR